MIPSLILCSLDRFRGIVDVYNYIIRVVNILTLIYLEKQEKCSMQIERRVALTIPC